MAYPTRAAVVAQSSVDELTGLNAAQQDGIYAASIAAIEAFCRQTFGAAVAETRRLDGSGSDVLFLKQRLESVSAIAIEGSSLSVSDVLIGDAGDRLELTLPTGNYYTRALADGDEPRFFRSGRRNVYVTGVWGWSDSPASVDQALRFDMEDTARADVNSLTSTILSFRKLGVKSIRQGALSADLHETAATLSDRAQALLDPDYVWLGRVGVVV